MLAIRLHAYGDPEVLRLDEIPLPEPGPREVRVRVHATALNPVDTKIRRGYLRAVVRLRLPWVLGMDVSGVVDAVGSKVRRFQVGDEVFSSPSHRRPGTYAEYTCLDEREVARKPLGLTHEEAASIPLAGLTAWECLVEAMDVRPDERVLIHAGSGGVGTLAIQIAKDLGAFVATTCSARNHDLVRSLGADLAIDYRTTRFEDVIEGYDAAIDALGGAIRGRTLSVLRPGGRLASIVSGMPEKAERFGPTLGVACVGVDLASSTVGARLKGRRLFHVVRKPDGAKLAKLGARIEAGAVKAVIDRVHSLEDAVEAHAYLEAGRARGKVVMTTGA